MLDKLIKKLQTHSGIESKKDIQSAAKTFSHSPFSELGKSEISLERYYKAFEESVQVFGRGEVSTYLLAGLVDSKESLINCSKKLISIGVYPFIVPFVPIAGTPLEHHPSPSTDFMIDIYQSVSELLNEGNIKSDEMSAGCAKCGACSALSLFES